MNRPENIKRYRLTNSVNDFLTKSCEEMYTTRVIQMQVEDKFVDDGTINEINVEKVSSSETPRRALEKRCKSAETFL